MLESLHRRPRGRRLALLLDAVRGRSTEAEAWAAVAPVPPPAGWGDPRATTDWSAFPFLDRQAPAWPPAGTVTRGLFDRLSAEQRQELQERLPKERRAWWDDLPDDDRVHWTVPLALAYVPGAEAATGLRKIMPPPEVHAMSHDVLATGGSAYYGDLIVQSLEQAGSPLAGGQAVLDFGCSSGRVVRVLQAWEPSAHYAGCDPNGPAVAWAEEHLPGVRFFASPTSPPLEAEEASYDVVYAISVWSHFDSGPALAWLGEMHRVLRPGGILLLTAQGASAVRRFVAHDPAPGNVRAMERVVSDLYVRGFSFFDYFEGTDWGVPANGWGMGFMTPEWLLERLTPRFELALFDPGRVEAAQDLYVLRKT